MMQFYPAPPNVAQGRPEYGYPAGPVATSPRMNWSPTMHPGAWGPYDFSAAYPAAYPPTSGEPRSPPYQVSSPNGQEHPGATSHNIRDILGAHPGGTLPSEVAKTPTSYQKSPTSTAAGIAVAVPTEYVRSPTTPNATPMQFPGKPFEGIVYSEVPGSFYVPALPRLPGIYIRTSIQVPVCRVRIYVTVVGYNFTVINECCFRSFMDMRYLQMLRDSD